MTDFALIKDASLKRVKAGEHRVKAGKFVLNALLCLIEKHWQTGGILLVHQLMYS